MTESNEIKVDNFPKDRPVDDFGGALSRYYSGIPAWATLVVAVFMTLAVIGIQDTIDLKVGQPLIYQLREKLGFAPGLDSRIKVFALNNVSVRDLRKDHLGAFDWASIIRALAQTEPKAIYINYFGDTPTLTEASYFKRLTENLDFPLVVQGVVENSTGETPYPIENLQFMPKTLYSGGVEKFEGEIRRNGVLVGLSSNYHSAFHWVGHFNYQNGKIPLLFRLRENYVVPAAPLFLSRRRAIEGSTLEVDGHPVPLREGKTLLNFPSKESFSSRVRPISDIFQKSRENRVAEIAEPGSIIVLAPRMHSGNWAFVDTPLGRQSSAYASTALINSVITGKWLSSGGMRSVYPFLGAASGALIAWVFPILSSAVFLALGSVALLALGVGLFSFFGIELPWAPMLVASWFSSALLLSYRWWHYERKGMPLKLALSGKVSPVALKRILARPHSVALEASERRVSVMVIDIVSFSLFARALGASEAVNQLKDLIGVISEIIHRHNGTVADVVGDGLLCFFGFQFEDSAVIDSHEKDAVRCAIDLQNELVKRNRKRGNLGLPIYPVRVGVHTDSVFVGDIGTDNQINLTLIGKGVGIARKLVASCDEYRVLISDTTRDALEEDFRESLNLKSRMVQMKHYESLHQSYEHDPFEGGTKDFAYTLSLYRNLLKIESRGIREDADKTILVKSALGEGTLVNFSRGGLGVHFSKYLGREVLLEFRLDSENGELGKELESRGIRDIAAEVRWGKETDSGEVSLGLQVKNLTEAQKSDLVQALIRFQISDTKIDSKAA